MPSKQILVGIVGVGLVGSELVSQILSIPAARNPFKIVFLASSTKVLYAPVVDADPAKWKAALAASTEAVDLKALGSYLRTLVAQQRGEGVVGRAVIVDNTSAESVAGMYAEWIGQGVSVVTPNKKGFSGDRGVWEGILRAAEGEGAGRWLNESTVGAGLPVINTLREMVGSGDRVRKIEGVFSGTMSYIFNEWSGKGVEKKKFSDVVRVAREKGYTEPHPADDLNGADVARKLTILARTIGARRGCRCLGSYRDVQTQSLIPKALEGEGSGDVFVSRLGEFDEEFERLREEAEREGSVLRFVGVVDVEKGVVKAGLEKYPVSHPFATSLGGSDNIIMFHTERYSPRPLIVQGAGAGAAVTAMGVLGDLLKLV
ncbi:homoserine dehydrogenase-domain-containing protein [Ephemerocybe angulata]|uniref:Homoserine dehydrogenase n=1 Tax=Ephemerocybe angulata TaxID=980116 RepID=A0A8H6MGT8_9AGAR|nr:homoserine dehydrogenase-domain-containing protein [Tulosesus angulatus]